MILESSGTLCIIGLYRPATGDFFLAWMYCWKICSKRRFIVVCDINIIDVFKKTRAMAHIKIYFSISWYDVVCVYSDQNISIHCNSDKYTYFPCESFLVRIVLSGVSDHYALKIENFTNIPSKTKLQYKKKLETIGEII